MFKKVLLILTALGVALVGVGFLLYASNTAPAVAPVAADEAARSGRPYVVKLHAQWCAVCLVTKDVWAEIEQRYANRVTLVVLDFTTDGNTEKSRAEAKRLGLQEFFDEYGGATGTIAVLDGRTKKVVASIAGDRDFAEYQTAIDAALATPDF